MAPQYFRQSHPRPLSTTLVVKEKRYNWFRVYDTFPGHRKWRLIAKMTGVGLGNVEAIVMRIFACANKAKPRGSVVDFDVYECAADLDLEPEAVGRVYGALEERSYIDNDYLTTWDDRQPDKKPDATNAERQQRWRDKKKEGRNGVTGVTRNANNALDTDKTHTAKQEAGIPHSEPVPLAQRKRSSDVKAGNSVQGEGEARKWLFGTCSVDLSEGCRLVQARLGLHRAPAQRKIHDYFRAIGQDPVELYRIIVEAHRSAIDSQHFETAIDRCIREFVAERDRGPPLPMPPVVQRGGAA